MNRDLTPSDGWLRKVACSARGVIGLAKSIPRITGTSDQKWVGGWVRRDAATGLTKASACVAPAVMIFETELIES